jgi:hypothetical protein
MFLQFAMFQIKKSYQAKIMQRKKYENKYPYIILLHIAYFSSDDDLLD